MLPKEKGGVVDHNLKVTCFPRCLSCCTIWSRFAYSYRSMVPTTFVSSIYRSYLCTSPLILKVRLICASHLHVMFLMIPSVAAVYGIAEQGMHFMPFQSIGRENSMTMFDSCGYYQGHIRCLNTFRRSRSRFRVIVFFVFICLLMSEIGGLLYDYVEFCCWYNGRVLENITSSHPFHAFTFHANLRHSSSCAEWY